MSAERLPELRRLWLLVAGLLTGRLTMLTVRGDHGRSDDDGDGQGVAAVVNQA